MPLTVLHNRSPEAVDSRSSVIASTPTSSCFSFVRLPRDPALMLHSSFSYISRNSLIISKLANVPKSGLADGSRTGASRCLRSAGVLVWKVVNRGREGKYEYEEAEDLRAVLQ